MRAVSRAFGDGACCACCWRDGCGETDAASDSAACTVLVPGPSGRKYDCVCVRVYACGRVLGRFFWGWWCAARGACSTADVVRRCATVARRAEHVQMYGCVVGARMC